MAKRDKGVKERADERAKRRGEKPKPDPNSASEWGKSILFAIVLFLFLRSFVIQTFVITSGSMEETLLVGDMLIVNRAAIRFRIPGTTVGMRGYSTPKHGDVLVFDPHHEDELMLIKRLMGMPGDTLEMREKVLYRNGTALDEPYVQHQAIADFGEERMGWQRRFLTDEVDALAYAPTRDTWGPLVVPEGHYFMLGDNREESFDSRFWGMLEAWRLEGRAVVKYYSYNKGSMRAFPAIREVRWGRIGRPIR